ncbi:MAG: GNAT family N-acetyltransferase [Xanthomonadales bacterium]|nr:GNAT family N-acetyltransferase [Xanthomonadales bacterium]
MTTALAFRAATDADIPAILGLVQSAYRGEASRAGWTTEADLLDGQRTDPAGIAEIIDEPDGLLLLAEADGELVACIHLERMERAAYFGMFSVRPTLQAQGIGRAVLAEAERRVREDWGATEMRMTVISLRDELIAWYGRRGYHPTGQQQPFPYGDARFGLPRRDDLCFAWFSKPLNGGVA